MHAMDYFYFVDLFADPDTLVREKQLLNAFQEPTSGVHARTHEQLTVANSNLSPSVSHSYR